ncbi:hypothetical protein ACN2AS_24295 [Serratia liquefaciens]|uniref:hypothetical protein n=1 Tax=Serratia liquefaciens TaxID=614 RepID=UPI003AF3BC02
MAKVNVKAVLLRNDQIEAIRKLQDEVSEKSGIGVAPSIHAIARGLVDSALSAKVPAFGFDVDNELVAGFDKGTHTGGEVAHE